MSSREDSLQPPLPRNTLSSLSSLSLFPNGCNGSFVTSIRFSLFTRLARHFLGSVLSIFLGWAGGDNFLAFKFISAVFNTSIYRACYLFPKKTNPMCIKRSVLLKVIYFCFYSSMSDVFCLLYNDDMYGCATSFRCFKRSCLYIYTFCPIILPLAGRLNQGTDRPKFERLVNPKQIIVFKTFRRNQATHSFLYIYTLDSA